MLPIELQMQIDLAAADLRRDVADGFAKLRAELLPEPKPDPQRASMIALQAMLANDPRANMLRGWPSYNGMGLWGASAAYQDPYGVSSAWNRFLGY